jgi:hypothetical protein
MDTRFWGPSGWKLLHLITFTYQYSAENALSYASFFETLPYILPCKFCRSSLTDYYRAHPYDLPGEGMNPTLDVPHWMFIIHNCVNHKLKSQGLNPNRDPTFSQVKEAYMQLMKSSWEDQLMLFWNFLFAVGYHHPKEAAPHSQPMPNCPAGVARCKDPCEKNKWNVLSWRKRMHWFRRFWVFLPAVLPPEISSHWIAVEAKNPPTFSCRRSTMAWLWRMRCGLDSRFRDPYTTVCKAIAQHSSDCGKTYGAITCRTKRLRKTVKKSKKTKGERK